MSNTVVHEAEFLASSRIALEHIRRKFRLEAGRYPSILAFEGKIVLPSGGPSPSLADLKSSIAARAGFLDARYLGPLTDVSGVAIIFWRGPTVRAWTFDPDAGTLEENPSLAERARAE